MLSPGMLRSILGIASTTLGFLSAGCGPSVPTTATGVWRDPSHFAGPLTQILVVAEAPGERRETMEDTFVAALKERGVEARPSYRLYPLAPPAGLEGDRDLRRLGFDGVLVARVKADTERPATVVEGEYRTWNFWGGFPGYGGIVGYGGAAAWGGAGSQGSSVAWSGTREYQAPYVVEERTLSVDTTLMELRGPRKVLWVETSKTTNPRSSKELATSLTKAVIPALSKAGFIPAKKKK